ncbi:hypothetical protein LCGC14_2882280 [marine sediment metagenome]|uniref:Uncharacterized protein n=1 Tax=marine sediment metagenome TaxID=412755 RepID=A0A0F8Y001_9ZZZZ
MSLKLSDLEQCPTHKTPLKMGKVEDFTVVWCADCAQHIREQAETAPMTLWVAYYMTNKVTDEEQS